METRAYKNWWMLAINGLIAILFGFLLLAFPYETISDIVFWFGLAMLGFGLLLVILAIRNIKKDKGSVLIILEAVATIALGVIIILLREHSIRIFLVMTGIWAVIVGIVQLVIFFRSRKSLPNGALLLINALVTIGLGVALFFIPVPFVRFSVIIAGVIACLAGILMIYYSFALRKIRLIPETRQETPPVKPEK